MTWFEFLHQTGIEDWDNSKLKILGFTRYLLSFQGGSGVKNTVSSHKTLENVAIILIYSSAFVKLKYDIFMIAANVKKNTGWQIYKPTKNQDGWCSMLMFKYDDQTIKINSSNNNKSFVNKDLENNTVYTDLTLVNQNRYFKQSLYSYFSWKKRLSFHCHYIIWIEITLYVGKIMINQNSMHVFQDHVVRTIRIIFARPPELICPKRPI